MSDPVPNDDDRRNADVPKIRFWGPASYWRSGLVLMAIIIAGVLIASWMAPVVDQ